MSETPIDSLVARIAESAPIHLLRTPVESVRELAQRWSERHRFWHGPDHLLSLLSYFENQLPHGEGREILLLTALYHDAIYDPRATDNEEASARLLCDHAADPADPIVRRAVELINASRWAEPPSDRLTWRFWEADCLPLAEHTRLADRLAYERAIFREYQWAPWPLYCSKRAEFLRNWAERFPRQREGVGQCLELLSGLNPRIAVYPGSFDPFHRGHLSILRQAESMFDKIIVGVAANRQKAAASVSLGRRCGDLRARLAYHEVVEIEGLLTDFVSTSPLPLTVVRGVRDGTDVEADLRFSRFLNDLRPGTRVVWIACEAALQHVSSSAIRELEAISPGTGSTYVPDMAEIYKAI